VDDAAEMFDAFGCGHGPPDKVSQRAEA
jgi:hypothetical protein